MCRCPFFRPSESGPIAERNRQIKRRLGTTFARNKFFSILYIAFYRGFCAESNFWIFPTAMKTKRTNVYSLRCGSLFSTGLINNVTGMNPIIQL